MKNFPDYTIENLSAKIPAAEYLRHYRDAEKFMTFCRQCRQYNARHACPPYDFDSDAYVAGYETVFIFGAKIIPGDTIRARCTTLENSKAAVYEIFAGARKIIDEKLLALEREHTSSRAFFAGTCLLCPEGKCARVRGEPCIFPEKIRPSLEALGFDLGKTTTDLLGIPLRWSADHRLPEYYVLVSGLFLKGDLTSLEKRSYFS